MSSEELLGTELYNLLKPAGNILDRKKHVSNIGDKVAATFPPCPEDYTEKVIYYFYYSVQFLLFYMKLNGEKPIPDIINDSDDIIREKIYFIIINDFHNEFLKIIENMKNDIYNLISNRLSIHLQYEKDHGLFQVLKSIVLFKELHSRRIKADPSASRTKNDIVQKTFNIITQEEYDPKNKDHGTWRMLIFNPLPSDFDNNAIDPNEGGREYALTLEAAKLQNTYKVPDPFYVVVTTEWDKIFRMLHTLIHFNEYMHMYIIGTIEPKEIDYIESLEKWEDVWKYAMKEHFDVPIKNLSREKKKVPNFVSRVAELRDFLKSMVEFQNKC